MTRRAILYARVSYDDRKNEDRNLEGQLEDYRAYCQQKGYRIAAELAEDDRGASGADWDLPKLNEALDMARAGQADVLVTRELDRFARGLAKQLVIESEFKRYGVDVEYTLAEYEDTPEGRLNKHIRATIAEFEREKINQRMTRGRRGVVKGGKPMLHGDRPPYGYRVEDGMLVICEPEARIVGLFFTWYVIGDENGKKLGAGEIAQKLTEMGVPTWADTHNPNFYKVQSYGTWHKGTIRKLLSKETYAGKWTYKQGPKDQWVSIEILPIIPRELWEAAQKQKVRNRELAKRNAKHPYLLRGRIYCGLCGSLMTGGSNGKRFYYACPRATGRLVGGGCDCRPKYFRADQVDEGVWGWLGAVAHRPETARQAWERQWAWQEEKSQPLRDRLAIIDGLLADNRRQLEKLLDRYLAEDWPREWLTERKTRLAATIGALEKERAALQATLEAGEWPIMDFETIIQEMATGFELRGRTPEERRQLVDYLDLTVVLTASPNERKLHIQCRIGRGAIEATSLRSWAL